MSSYFACLMPTTILVCKKCRNTNLIRMEHNMFCAKCDKDIHLHDVAFLYIHYDLGTFLTSTKESKTVSFNAQD